MSMLLLVDLKQNHAPLAVDDKVDTGALLVAFATEIDYLFPLKPDTRALQELGNCLFTLFLSLLASLGVECLFVSGEVGALREGGITANYITLIRPLVGV